MSAWDIATKKGQAALDARSPDSGDERRQAYRNHCLESLLLDRADFDREVGDYLESIDAYRDAATELPFLVLAGSDLTETVSRLRQMADWYISAWADAMLVAKRDRFGVLRVGHVTDEERREIEREINKKWGAA